MSYLINGVDLSTYGFQPGRAPGSNIALENAWSLPPRSGKTFHDWGDEHGVEPYVTGVEMRFEGRNLYLHGLILGSGDVDATQKINQLQSAIRSWTDLVVLETPWDDFSVYVKDKIATVYHGYGVVSITITCREPSPRQEPPAEAPINPAAVAISSSRIDVSWEKPPELVPGSGYTLDPGNPDDLLAADGIDGVTFADFGLLVTNLVDELTRPATKEAYFTSYLTEGYQVTKESAPVIRINAVIDQPTYTTFENVIYGLFASMTAEGMRYLTKGQEAVAEFFVVDGFRVYDVQSIGDRIIAQFEMDIIYNKELPDLTAPVLIVTEEGNKLGLDWADVSNDEDGFKIYRGLETGFVSNETSLYKSIPTPNLATYDDIEVTPGIEYFYRVASYKSSTIGALSNEDSGLLPAPVLCANRNTLLSPVWSVNAPLTSIDGKDVKGLEAMVVNSDGTLVIAWDRTNSRVLSWVNTTAFDMNTRSSIKSRAILFGQDGTGMSISSDGEHLYFGYRGGGLSMVVQWDFGTAWDIDSLPTGIQGSLRLDNRTEFGELVPEGVKISPDGLKFWAIGRSNVASSRLIEFSLAADNDLTSPTVNDWIDLNASFGIGRVADFDISEDGDKIMILDSQNEKFVELELSIPWDQRSATKVREYDFSGDDVSGLDLLTLADHGQLLYTDKQISSFDSISTFNLCGA